MPLHAYTHILNSIMPTEREYKKYNEIKSDQSSFRLHFLQSATLYKECKGCMIVHVIVHLLALYGLYKLIF